MVLSPVRDFPRIKAVRTFVPEGRGVGGDYHDVERGHWYEKIELH
jgi:L-rhamnonate dehydratase